MEESFYHLSKIASKVLKQGLAPTKGKEVVWMDSSLEHLAEINRRFPYKNAEILRIDSSFLDASKLEEDDQMILGKITWWRYRGVIPPEAISYPDEGG